MSEIEMSRMNGRGNLIAACLASLAVLPILFGVALLADAFTRASVGLILFGNGHSTEAVQEPIWPEMIVPLLLGWGVVSAIIVSLAYLGLGPSGTPPKPPVPPSAFNPDVKLVARAGERVLDSDTGAVICRVKNDIYRHRHARAADFHGFADGEEPWAAGKQLSGRCFRINDTGDVEIFVEGEWRP